MALSRDGKSGKADLESHSSADSSHAANISGYGDLVLAGICFFGLAVTAFLLYKSQALLLCIAKLYIYIYILGTMNC